MFWLLIKCPCGRSARPKCRQRTAYVDDELNWVQLCEDCLVKNAEHWDDMWNDYWYAVMGC